MVPHCHTEATAFFIFSLVDYMLYLQPLTSAPLTEDCKIESKCLKYKLNVKVTQRQVPRALLVAKLLPLRLRRCIHLSKVISNFSHSRNSSQKNNERTTELGGNIWIWNDLRIPEENTFAWVPWDNVLMANCAAQSGRRRYMEAHKPLQTQSPNHAISPLLYTKSISIPSQDFSKRWYRNRIEGSRSLSGLHLDLQALLTKRKLAENDDHNVELEILSLILTHPRQFQKWK